MTPQVGAKWETYALQFSQFSHPSFFYLMYEKNINCTDSINPFDKILNKGGVAVIPTSYVET
jgi:hypothetical protein